MPKKGSGTAMSDDLNFLDSFETATSHHLNPHLESIMVMAYGLATKDDKVAHEPKIITGMKGQKLRRRITKRRSYAHYRMNIGRDSR